MCARVTDSSTVAEPMIAPHAGGTAAPPRAPSTPVPGLPAPRQVRGRQRRHLRRYLLALWLLGAGAALIPGLPYYRMSAEERAYSELHEVFAPTGAVGHTLGYAGTLLIVAGVTMYSLRKRLSVLQGVGLLPTWLSVHIFMCSLGAYLVVLHTSMRLRGLAAVAFWAMIVAVVSGVIGRYLYVRIPRARDGHERTLGETRARVTELTAELKESNTLAQRLELAVGAPFAPPSSTLLALVSTPLADLRRHAALRRARRALKGVDRATRSALLGLVDERLRLEQQIAFLRPVQRVLRYWHVLHIPIALVMFIALALHITVAVLFGYGWPF